MGHGCHDDWGSMGWCTSVDTRQEAQAHMEVWEKTRENMRKKVELLYLGTVS